MWGLPTVAQKQQQQHALNIMIGEYVLLVFVVGVSPLNVGVAHGGAKTTTTTTCMKYNLRRGHFSDRAD